MNQYRLVLTVEIEGSDDVDARNAARSWLSQVNSQLNVGSVKFQKIYHGKPPEGIKL